MSDRTPDIVPSNESQKPSTGNIDKPVDPFPFPPPGQSEEPTGSDRKPVTVGPDK